MSDLEVDLDALRAFASTMRDVEAGLESAFAWLNDRTGDPVVDKAMKHFEYKWSDGRRQVRENMKGLADIADSAVDNFTKADDELNRSLTASESGS